jgi:hypothetical protein
MLDALHKVKSAVPPWSVKELDDAIPHPRFVASALAEKEAARLGMQLTPVDHVLLRVAVGAEPGTSVQDVYEARLDLCRKQLAIVKTLASFL